MIQGYDLYLVLMTAQHASDAAQRQIMALYYAYGRSDGAAPTNTRVDPIDFSEFYLGLFQEFTSGQCSHMPSVQDAWDLFRRSVAS